MVEYFDEQLTHAHNYGVANVDLTYRGSAIFEYGGNTYRIQIIEGQFETKLICNAIVSITGLKPNTHQARPSKEYLVLITSITHSIEELRYLKPRQILSQSAFTKILLSVVPFGRFYGNREDFADFVQYFLARGRNNLQLKTES